MREKEQKRKEKVLNVDQMALYGGSKVGELGTINRR